MRRLLHRSRRAFLYTVIRFFRIRHATEHIARGFAIGLVPNFFPTFGFGAILSAFLARATGGSAAAGFIGGLLLTFLWPVLFFLNMQTGSLFIHPRLLIDELDDVTEKAIQTLLWGPAFTLGAILNGLLAGLVAYLTILLFYQSLRPHALNYFRTHARTYRHKRI